MAKTVHGEQTPGRRPDRDHWYMPSPSRDNETATAGCDASGNQEYRATTGLISHGGAATDESARLVAWRDILTTMRPSERLTDLREHLSPFPTTMPHVRGEQGKHGRR